MLLQNRGGALADVDLYYDHPNERNLNIIKVCLTVRCLV